MAILRTTNITNNIQRPSAGRKFELKQSIVQLLHTNGQFIKLPHEDPQVHLQNFFVINDTYILLGVLPDYMQLTLFPFSLLEEAKRKLKSEPPNSITSWDDLARKFLIRFFLFGKTTKLRSEILSLGVKYYKEHLLNAITKVF